MPRSIRLATLLVALSLTLTACAGAEAQATAPDPTVPPAPSAAPAPTPSVGSGNGAAPTSAPEPTAVPTLAKGVLVAGVDVGGLTAEDARKKLEGALQPLLLPLELQAGASSTTLKPEDIGLELPLDAMLAQAQAAQPSGRVELQVNYDEARLRAVLGGMASSTGAPGAISVISDTKTIS